MVLHSVPPLVVFVAAEAVTDLRDKLTDAVSAAFTAAAEQAVHEPVTAVHEPSVPDREPDAPQPAAERRAGRPARRKLFADYLADARAAWAPGVEVSPAWVREVTGCSRGLSSRLAAALAAEIGEGVRRDG